MILATLYVLKAFHLALIRLSFLSEISVCNIFNDLKVSCTGSVDRRMVLFASLAVSLLGIHMWAGTLYTQYAPSLIVRAF